jgi:hypothetical protein
MKVTTVIGIMTAAILLVGCGRNSSSTIGSNTPSKAQSDTSSVVQTDAPSQEPPRSPTDDELRQKVTGVWKYSHHFLGVTNEDTFTFAPNGNYAKQSVTIRKAGNKTFLGLGTWQVKDGVLIAAITKVDPIPQGPVGDDLRKGLASGAFISRHKIISVNDRELVCEVDVYTITGTGGHSKSKGTVTWTRQETAPQTK